jgi:putative acetyltransferase
LADALEALAAARGAKEITVEVSDTAEGFFEDRGYVATQRNSTRREGEWLSSTTMKKALTASRPTSEVP